MAKSLVSQFDLGAKRQRSREGDKQQHVGGFVASPVRNNPTSAGPARFDRGASNRNAERQRNDGVAPLMVRGELALAWHHAT
jgi:hypothetical protein